MNSKTNFEKVCEFNSATGAAQNLDLQFKLIAEEFAELAAEIPTTLYAFDMYRLIGDDEYAERLGRSVKEAVDLLYVTYGFLQALGVDADKAFEIVHESNMSKLGSDGKPIKREDGKILKGPNYKPVNPRDLYTEASSNG